jgi:hypothetical protein
MTKPLTDRLAKFFDAVMEASWEGSGLDGGEAQDLAESLGLIERVDFNPDVHEDHYGIGLRAGDDWYQFAPDVRAAVNHADREEAK